MTATSTGRPVPSQPASGERRALSPELSHFLVQLSIALHKTATYPSGHPALEKAVQTLLLRINALHVERPVVGVGVARDRLVIEGGATDPTNAVLRGLAESLHRHQIGSLRFERGISPAELSSFLVALADGSRGTVPLGLQEKAAEKWTHISFTPVALDELELAEAEAGNGRAHQLWLRLASATLRRDPDELTGPMTGSELARSIRRNVRDASYDRVIAEYMLQVGEELVKRGGSAQQVAKEFGELVAELGEDTMRLLLEMGSDPRTRQKLVLELNRVLPARAVVTLTRAAADASKQAISHALLRLFTKLAANAEATAGPVSAAADNSLRDAISQMVEGWTLADPNPERYRELLHFLTFRSRTGDARSDPDAFADAIRIIEVAVEADSVGPAVWRAIDELLEYGRLSELVEVLAAAPPTTTTRRIREYLVAPERIASILGSQQSRQAIDAVLEWAGVDAASAMLDALESADSRATRRQIMARLASMGGDIGPLVMERLRKGPWYVTRNMLVLLGEIRIPAEFTPGPYLEHEDARVRREAIKVALRVPSWHEEAILAGLRDRDTRTLNLVLAAAQERPTPALAPPLIGLLVEAQRGPGLRAQAIRALGRTGTAEARDWLLRNTLGRRRWSLRRKLAPKSPELLASLEALTHWPAHPNAARVLRLAARNPDPDIRLIGRRAEATS